MHASQCTAHHGRAPGRVERGIGSWAMPQTRSHCMCQRSGRVSRVAQLRWDANVPILCSWREPCDGAPVQHRQLVCKPLQKGLAHLKQPVKVFGHFKEMVICHSKAQLVERCLWGQDAKRQQLSLVPCWDENGLRLRLVPWSPQHLGTICHCGRHKAFPQTFVAHDCHKIQPWPVQENNPGLSCGDGSSEFL